MKRRRTGGEHWRNNAENTNAVTPPPNSQLRTHVNRLLHNEPQEVPFGLKVDDRDCLFINEKTILSHGGKKVSVAREEFKFQVINQVKFYRRVQKQPNQGLKG